MPFKEINVNDIIEKQKKDDPEFEKAWTEFINEQVNNNSQEDE